MQAYAKLGGEKVEDLRRALAERGYFVDKPRDLAPEPELFNEVETRQKVARTTKHLSRYMGPADPTDPQFVSPIMNEAKILDWIGQYPDDCHEMAVSVVHGIRLLSRDDASAGLQSFHDGHPDFAGASVVPLGEPKDGSAVHTYHLGDAANRIGYSLASLESALLKTQPIIFSDDLVGRGSSAISIFEAMLGVDATTNLNEQRGKAQSQEAIERLRAANSSVVLNGVPGWGRSPGGTATGAGLGRRGAHQ
jgi:hypothetical protein